MSDKQIVFSFKISGKNLLIDAGNAEDGDKIVAELKQLGISTLDYVIGTHIHEDHIGGMDKIVENFTIGAIYLPYNKTSTAKYYERLLTAIQAKSLKLTKAEIGEIFALGEANCVIKSVDHTEPKEPNNASIVLQINYKNHKYLLMGDAEKEVEKQGDWEDIDVLKVGHHGSNTSSSQEFLQQVKPEIAVIPVGTGNSYGLPKEEILQRYEQMGSKIYRTDTDGTIHIIDNGEEITVQKVAVSLNGGK